MCECFFIKIYKPLHFTTIVHNSNWNLRFDSFDKVLCDSVHAESVTARFNSVVEISIIILFPFSTVQNILLRLYFNENCNNIVRH